MANPRQRHKQKSGRRLTRRTADKARRGRAVTGNELVSKYWDPKLTLKQNYARLGLMATPNRTTGGVERKSAGAADAAAEAGASLPMESGAHAVIRRDADGNVIEVVLPADAPDSDAEQAPALVEARGLVAPALEDESLKAAPIKRWQSDGETRWLASLVDAHGDDFRAMARDPRLNPMQQTAAEIRRRVQRWQQSV